MLYEIFTTISHIVNYLSLEILGVDEVTVVDELVGGGGRWCSGGVGEEWMRCANKKEVTNHTFNEKHDDVSGCPISGAVVDSLEEIARILCDYCDESFKDLRDSILHLREKHPCLFYPLVADIAETISVTNYVVLVFATNVSEDEDVVVLVSATNVSKGTDDFVFTAMHGCSAEDSSNEWHLEEIYMPWTHLEKKRTRLRTYTNISQEYAYKAWRQRHKIHVLENQLLSVSLLICLGKHDYVEGIPSCNSLYTTLPPNMVYPLLSLSFLCVNCFVTDSRQPPWETRILSVLLETTPNLATRAPGTPLSSSQGTTCYLFDSTPSGSITTWGDLTTRFLAQFFPPGRIAKLRNYILMFQQHHGESLFEAWNRFK
nr:zinc finger, CCHC-type [Tanacetum cinerariifolium]